MKLTNRNYFSVNANKEFMSVSQYKSFEKCEAMALAEVKGRYKREESTALLVGSYIDSYYDGTLDAFRKYHPELFKRDGTLKSEYVKADEIIARCNKDKLFTKYISGGQRQVIMTGEIEGVKVKCKIDCLHDDMIVDGKVMRDMGSVYVEGQGRVPFFEAWKYDLQGAVYQEIVRQNTGNVLPFFLAVATKEEVPDIDIIRIEQPSLDASLEEFRSNAPSFDAIKKGIMKPDRCEECAYCRKTKKLTEPTSSEEYYLI